MRRLILPIMLAPTLALGQIWPPPPPEPWITADWVGGGASAVGGSAALIALGYALGLGAEDLLDLDTDIFRFTGSLLGGMFGPSLGIGLYGAIRGHDGFAGGLAGSMACVMGIGLASLPTRDPDNPARWPLYAGAAALPVCASIGYGWLAGHRADEGARRAVLPMTSSVPGHGRVLGVQWIGAPF